MHNGHQIDFENTWTGKETVTYDGQIVSEKRTLSGGVHVFNVIEGNESAHYEVEVRFQFRGAGSYLGVTIRRNGMLLFTNDSRHKKTRPSYGVIREQESLLVTAGPVRETVVREVLLVVCHHCGHKNEATTRFCGKCGASV